MNKVSFKSFLKSFALVFFNLVFATQALAAPVINWTPPSGPPLGNNVPAPVNIGNSTQTKSGSLTVDGTLTSTSNFLSQQSSTLKGQTIVTNKLGGGNNFLVSFIKNYFYADAQFGQPNPIGYPDPVVPTPVNVGIFGQLKYQTADDNGTPIPVQPGSVLSSDANGNANWVDVYSLIDPSQSLVQGSVQGQTLYWDTTTHAWKIASDVLTHSPNSLFKVDGSIGDLNVDTVGGVHADLLSVNQGLHVNLANSPSPTVGQVLTLADTSGNVAWQTAPGSGSVSIDPGTSDGQTLRWNPGQTKWEPTNGVQVHSSAISVGDLLNTSFLQLQTKTAPGSYITLNSPAVHIPLGGTASANKVLASTDGSGNLAWVDPATLGGGGGGLPAGEMGDTLWYNGSAWLNTNKLQYDGSGNNLRFNGDQLQLKGNANALNPDSGRFLQSLDTNGTAVWNKNFLYTPLSILNTNIDLYQIKDDPDPNTFPVFANYGNTYLAGPVNIDGETKVNNNLIVTGNNDLTIEGQGDLYLPGIEQPGNTTDLAHLCINLGNHKVVRCENNTISSAPEESRPQTITYGPEDNGEHYTFNQDDNITLKWCGGGGGGGGGGHGEPGTNNAEGIGGSGGGGGEAADCQTQSLSVNSGDTLTWNIGSGGLGGAGGSAFYEGSLNINPNGNASDGSTGGQTSVSLNGTQVGSTADGGLGGHYGHRPGEYNGLQNCPNPLSGPVGGLGGNINLSTNTNTNWWHNGQCGYVNAGNNCHACGGIGGDGQRGPNDGAVAGNIPSGGGGGGIDDGDASHNNWQYAGKGGNIGELASGGGGGGGGFGKVYFTPFGFTAMLKGGTGGRGGNGYLEISGLNQPGTNTISELVFTSPGDHTIPFNSFPTTLGGDVVHIQIWGAGGGGGGVLYQTNDTAHVTGGGGGSGAYIMVDYLLPTCVTTHSCGNNGIPIHIGAGGSLGNSSASNNVDPGADGGATTVGTTPYMFSAPGGHGGEREAYAGQNDPGNTLYPGTGGAGGVPGGYVPIPPTYPAVTTAAGQAGQSGSLGGNGAQGVQGGFGSGGDGSTIYYYGGVINTSGIGTDGQNGRVRAWWIQ